jgi:hypothetical protein
MQADPCFLDLDFYTVVYFVSTFIMILAFATTSLSAGV